MKRFFYAFVCLFASFALTTVIALEMEPESEQFYVVQGIFAELAIEAVTCQVEDPVINFACGQFEGDLARFQAQLDNHINEALPGLFLALDWFENGETIVRDYRSAAGKYLFGYNPGGFIVIAFTPR